MPLIFSMYILKTRLSFEEEKPVNERHEQNGPLNILIKSYKSFLYFQWDSSIVLGKHSWGIPHFCFTNVLSDNRITCLLWIKTKREQGWILSTYDLRGEKWSGGHTPFNNNLKEPHFHPHPTPKRCIWFKE